MRTSAAVGVSAGWGDPQARRPVSATSRLLYFKYLLFMLVANSSLLFGIEDKHQYVAGGYAAFQCFFGVAGIFVCPYVAQVVTPGGKVGLAVKDFVHHFVGLPVELQGQILIAPIQEHDGPTALTQGLEPGLQLAFCGVAEALNGQGIVINGNDFAVG